MHRATVVFGILLAACGSSAPTNSDGNADVATVVVTPATADLNLQQTAQLTAVAKAANGATVSGQVFTWSAAPAGIVTVGSSGGVTAIAAGNATVTASTGGKSGSASIVVHAAAPAGTPIGTAGGTVTAATGGASVEIPTEALSATTMISVASEPNPPTAPLLLPGSAFEFGPTGTQFASPVTIRIPYTLPSGFVQSKLRLHTYVGGSWQQVPGSYVDSAAHTVVGAPTHFTLFTLCQFPCYPEAPRVEVYFGSPQPIVVFAGMTSEMRVVNLITNNVLPGTPTITLSGAPSGVSMNTQFGGTFADGVYYNASFVVSPGVPAGRYLINVIGHAAGAPDSPTPVQLIVVATSYGLTVQPTGISAGVGSPGTGTVTIARNGFSNAVALSTVGLPAGVTAQFSPSTLSASQATSTLTLTATSGAALGSSSFTVRGTASGADNVDVPASLTVISPGGFGLTGTPPTVSVGQGASASTGIKTSRAAGFSGTVTYAVTSTLPAGMMAALAATSVADSMRLTITTTGAVLQGTYSVIVTGTSGGISNPVTITVTVSGAGTTTVALDLSGCAARNTTVWMAFRDGTGPFTQVTPTNGIYSFPIASGKGVTAIELTNGTTHDLNVTFGTPSELALLSVCRPPQQPLGNKSLTFGSSGLPAGDEAVLIIGGFSIGFETNVTSRVDAFPEGPLDLFGLRYRTGDPSQDVRGYLSRDQSFGAGTTTTIDFAGANTFTPLTATMTGFGSPTLALYTGPSCTVGGPFMPTLARQPVAPNNIYYGIPTALARPNDMYRFSTGSPTLYTAAYFHTFGPQTLSAGSPMPGPALATLDGPYRRVQATFALPADYAEAQFSYGAGQSGVELIGHPGYFGGNNFVLATPDLSGVPGFDPAWLPPTGSSGFLLRGRTAPYERCIDGSIYKEAVVTGN